MLKFLIMVVILVTAYIPTQNLIALDAPVKTAEPTFEEYILTYSKQFNSDPDIIYSVGMCESRGKWIKGDFRGGSYHSFGQFQYFEGTWNRYVKRYQETFQVSETFDIKSEHDAIKLTAWVFSLGEREKSEWTTYVAIKKGGTYSFYSKFHQKNFVVKCPLKKILVS